MWFIGLSALLALAALAFTVGAASRSRVREVGASTLAELCERSRMRDEADMITSMSSRDILRELLKHRN